MARKPIESPAPHVVGPPEDLTEAELAMWDREFKAVPFGHFVRADIPAMRDHVHLVCEEAEARAAMLVRNRTRDATAHWRGVCAAVMGSRRALRLLPNSRQTPRRAGLIAAGSASAEPDLFDNSRRDWRSLFPNPVAPDTDRKGRKGGH